LPFPPLPSERVDDLVEGRVRLVFKTACHKSRHVRDGETDAVKVPVWRDTRNLTRESGGAERYAHRRVDRVERIARAVPIDLHRNHAGKAPGKPLHAAVVAGGHDDDAALTRVCYRGSQRIAMRDIR